MEVVERASYYYFGNNSKKNRFFIVDNISEATYALIQAQIECTYRGKINAKNKGKIDMYFVN
ncbi:MAG: adenylate/guanylate cyclase domain-containing protein [Spirosomaceae bacterium]|nr:adenylate/guanylate cyclase domain-containing protein [Spirosomataceae bacterium]